MRAEKWNPPGKVLGRKQATRELDQTVSQKTVKRKGKAAFFQWMGPLLDALRELGDSAEPQETDC